MSRWVIPAAWALASPCPTCVAMSTASAMASAPPLDPLLQRLALVVRHHEVQLAVAAFVDLVDRADVRVVERRGRLGLLEEAALRGVVAGQIGRQDLDRHLAVEARVVGRVDDPHSAAADLGADRVRAEGGAWDEEHGNGAIIDPPRGPQTPGDSGGMRVAAAGLLGVVALALVGCGGDSSPTAPITTTATVRFDYRASTARKGVEAGSVQRDTKLHGERQICRLKLGGENRTGRDYP